MRANANDLVSRAEDPAKILDQALLDMQTDLVKLRQEALAREALGRRKNHADTAQALGQQLDSQAGQVETLKRSLLNLEGKLAQARKQLEGAVSGISVIPPWPPSSAWRKKWSPWRRKPRQWPRWRVKT